MKIKKLALKGNGQPTVSLFHTGLPAIKSSEEAAIERARVAAINAVGPNSAEVLLFANYEGKRQLWHPEFPSGLYVYVCDRDLFSLAASLEIDLPKWNGGKALNFFDFCYLADVLRQLLADSKTVQEALNLSRALAWVVNQGELKEND